MSRTVHSIQAYCHIGQGRIGLGDTLVFQGRATDFSGFIKEAYKHSVGDYPKFFKMDALGKLAFMAADVLLGSDRPATGQEANTAIVLSNRASSLDTDRRHQTAIQDPSDYYPSPAVFVYTLPNICIGEISIRHQLRTENSFFIFDRFNPDFLADYAESLLREGKADKVLSGWVDLDADHYEAFMYLVGKQGGLPHDGKTIKSVYKKPPWRN